MSNKHSFCSRAVDSNQRGIHEKLDKIILKHIKSHYQKPIQAHNQQAFDSLLEIIHHNSHQGLILDSCCGTGLSTLQLAQKYPNKLIIGVDQSEKRLNKQNEGIQVPDNCIWLRANCEDIWRLCVSQQIKFEQHYILYPNPWPKSDHLKRRWHGHPVFPVLQQLSPTTELRSNWQTYLLEFSRAWQLLTEKAFEVVEFEFDTPMTLFEKKYAGSGQKLYRLICES